MTLRNEIANVPMVVTGRSEWFTDNLAIAICTYWNEHMDRPEDDPIDEDYGWGKWVVEQYEATMDRIVAAVEKGQDHGG